MRYLPSLLIRFRKCGILVKKINIVKYGMKFPSSLEFMKYARLTKEQLEELKPEFVNFLATQSITGEEWATIKEKQPLVAEEEIDVFSDLVWEGVLSKAQYLEHISPNQMHLFLLGDKNMSLIAVKVNKEDIDITTAEGYAWLKENLGDDNVVFMSASKDYNEDHNVDKFKLISEGAVITRGDLYRWFERFVEVK